MVQLRDDRGVGRERERDRDREKVLVFQSDELRMEKADQAFNENIILTDSLKA